MPARFLQRIDAVPAAEWNALHGAGHPFLRHEWLAALEDSGSVGPGTGWEPHHLILEAEDGQLRAAMPLYLKHDSWGEFVFDFAWADAYRRAGLRYYPKLVSAIPFTPAASSRLLLADGEPAESTGAELLTTVRAYADETGRSSLHMLFPDESSRLAARSAGLMLRKDCQFHWHNRDYRNFDEFLASFTAEKRKKARRERRRIAEAGIRFRWLSGAELDPDTWRCILPLYARTFLLRGRAPYLTDRFFEQISARLPQHVVVITALHEQRIIAAAICFRSDSTLYGRYWGAEEDYHSLHFETCYYQGIEYCIEHGLERFEPGTQGEHKVSRGFVPAETWSAHWLTHPRFSAAVEQYLRRERHHIDDYIAAIRDHAPYRKESLRDGA